MRFPLALIILSLLAIGCDRQDATLHEQFVGTWIPGDWDGGWSGELIQQSDGSFHVSRVSRSDEAKRLVFSGTWELKDGFVISVVTNITKSPGYTNSTVRMGQVDRSRLVRLDGTRMVLECEGIEYSYHRK
jgi:hypothetical protein